MVLCAVALVRASTLTHGRDLIAMICGLSDTEAAALNIKSLGRSMDYEKMRSTGGGTHTCAISIEYLNQLLRTCATFRSKVYHKRVVQLLNSQDLTLARLFMMARVVSEGHFGTWPEHSGSYLGCAVLGLYYSATQNEGWFYGEVVDEAAGTEITIRYPDDESMEVVSLADLESGDTERKTYIIPKACVALRSF